MSDSVIHSSEKKPAIIITRFPYESSWGGEESHTLSIAKYLRDKGYEVIFMGSCPTLLRAFSNEGLKVRPTWGGKMCVTTWELIKSFLLFPFIKWNLARVFTELRADYDVRALYCLSLNEKLLLSSEAIRRNIPVTWVEHQEIRGWLLKSPWNGLYRSNARLVKIVPVSHKNKKCLLDLGIPVDRVVEIINGVGTSLLSNGQRQTKKGLVTYANRLIPKKGVEDFLEAIRILFQKNIPLEVVIIGEGELEQRVRSEILHSFQGKDVNIYHFLKKEKWYELLAKTDVFVSCARDSNETFSLNAAEALVSGCKLIVTKCSGISDYLIDQQDAFIIEPMSVSQLSVAIETALASDELIRQQGKKTALEKFEITRMLKEYELLILRSS